MSWLFISLQWYLMLFVIGIIFIPIANIFFKNFFDKGYPFAKIVGILLVGYLTYFLSTFQILPFSQLSILIILIVFAIISIKLVIDNNNKIKSIFSKKYLKIILLEEILFLVSFIVWVYIRGQEPSIRSLEKLMDFGFINSALKSNYFPPNDIWLSGYKINYYYFGHIIGAVLTKLNSIPSAITYNLILSQIFAMGITGSFSLSGNIVYFFTPKVKKYVIIAALLGAFLVNLGGNLHTIYSFYQPYQTDKPLPIWRLGNNCNISLNYDNNKQNDCFSLIPNLNKNTPPNIIPYLSLTFPNSYWYPNATRFIPYTIHEFPSYSYVVADLHGHVFDIPFVLLTLALLFVFFTENLNIKRVKKRSKLSLLSRLSLEPKYIITAIIFGFLTSIHFMTNAFDGAIYLLLAALVFVTALLSIKSLMMIVFMGLSFMLFNLPFSTFFEPFVTGIGINCPPGFLTKLASSNLSYSANQSLAKIGPFIIEPNNCQSSTWWELFALWGFFWINGFFLLVYYLTTKKKIFKNIKLFTGCLFLAILFLFSTWLVIIPEFFYIKDIYPAHFRANTMFKLGYQAFMMMAISSSVVFIISKEILKTKNKWPLVYFVIFIPIFFLVMIYPSFAIPSYYPNTPIDQLNNKFNFKYSQPQLDGTTWVKNNYSEYTEIINYLDKNAAESSVILEAQGDSYTDYNIVSSFTGLSTVAGWYVHEWLWRGDPNIVGSRIPDIVKIYESTDIYETQSLLKKYKVDYVIIGSNEKKKYPNININKFNSISHQTIRTKKGNGYIFKVK